MQLPNVLPRGIHLASLFMSGVETAVFANDVCGAPIPWNMCPPWHYFDGKLFHYKLLKANNNTPLIDMCDGQVNSFITDNYITHQKLTCEKNIYTGNL